MRFPLRAAATLLGLAACSSIGTEGPSRLAAVRPLAAQAATPAVSAATLRVVAYNIKHGRGMDDRVDLARIADVLRRLDADVITLQEVDDRTERTGGVDQVAVLADLLGYEGVHGPHRPYQGGFYGNAVLTRLPVVREQTHPIPGASGSALAVLEVTVEVPPPAESDQSPLSSPSPPLLASVVSVHLAGTPEERMAQARAVDTALASRPLAILAGDFNGRPDDPVVRSLESAWVVERKSGDPRTYPSPEPDREIDFVMWAADDDTFDGSAVEIVEHLVIDESMASDHRPILAVFEIRR